MSSRKSLNIKLYPIGLGNENTLSLFNIVILVLVIISLCSFYLLTFNRQRNYGMENKLAENIRAFRKERQLTQEQLAEVLNVTVGAVYKWEAKLSRPELSLIMEMADFFDTSMDVLLGYEMKDNRVQVVVGRLKEYKLNKAQRGLLEA